MTLPNVFSLFISLLALTIAVKGYLRKAGVSVRGNFAIASSRDCNDQFVSKIILENLKDRAVTILGIYLKISHSYYVEIENFDNNPLVLKPYETYCKDYGPIEFYAWNQSRMDLNDLLSDASVRKALILSTADGRYTVPQKMHGWSPVYEYFRNYSTVIARPIRSTYNGQDIGGNMKFAVKLTVDGEKDSVLVQIHPDDYQVRLFRNFSLTQDSLASTAALKKYLYHQRDLGKIQFTKIEVLDLQHWRGSTQEFYRGERTRAENVSAFGYYVTGKISTIISDFTTRRRNARIAALTRKQKAASSGEDHSRES